MCVSDYFLQLSVKHCTCSSDWKHDGWMLTFKWTPLCYFLCNPCMNTWFPTVHLQHSDIIILLLNYSAGYTISSILYQHVLYLDILSVYICKHFTKVLTCWNKLEGIKCLQLHNRWLQLYSLCHQLFDAATIWQNYFQHNLVKKAAFWVAYSLFFLQ